MSSEHYLSKEDIKSLSEELKDEHKEIEDWIISKRKEMGSVDRDLSDPIDIASNHISYIEMKSEVTRKKIRMAKIEKSLRNMVDFGYCEECGIEIGKIRLKIDATFNRCFECSSIKAIIDRNYIKR